MPKWRQWETTPEADWTLALKRESVVSEYEAEAIEQASMRWPLPLRQAPIGLEGHESVRDLRAKPGQQCVT